MKYKICITWSYDRYDYFCTDSEKFVVDDLEEYLRELPEKIEYIRRTRGPIISIQINKE